MIRALAFWAYHNLCGIVLVRFGDALATAFS